MRIYDATKCLDWHKHEIRLAKPFVGIEVNMIARMHTMQNWADYYCQGEYIMLLNIVVFELEGDALIFKLKYG